MKTYFLLPFLCFSSLFGVCQQLAPEKTSPFTAVRWEKEQPIVRVENEWYQLEKLDHFNTEELLNFCKKQYGSKWQKRFSEDLVEVLHELGYASPVEVTLQLSKNGQTVVLTGTFSSQNRSQLVLYNRGVATQATVAIPRQIPIREALADLNQFQEMIQSVSSYSRLSHFDYTGALKKITDSIIKANLAVDVNRLTNDIAKVMAELGDRHASVRNESLEKKALPTYNLRLPFALATLNGKLVGLKKNAAGQRYSYYDEARPYLKCINGVTVETLVNIFNYRDKKAPAQAKLTRGSSAIEKYGKLLAEYNMACPEQVAVVFTNGHDERTETFQLTTENKGYSSTLREAQNLIAQQISQKNFSGLSKVMGDRIGYLNIPEMYNEEDVEGLQNAIKNAFKNFADTRALIIDIRNNPGGSRAILQTFATYLIQAPQSPWVANIAYLRTDKAIVGDEESMSARYLYSYHSKQFSDRDRKAIDQFNKKLKLQQRIDFSRFSDPFYMVLHHNERLAYKQTVYILVNEESFSAASVFASAFKGLPNVKIVGETTDGSSGNSKTLYLKNSNIKVNVSTMLSFQRNGKTLDGNGTTPDIIIPADENQVLNGYDSQLNRLIEIINSAK